MSVGVFGGSASSALPQGATALVAQKKIKGFGYTYPSTVAAGTYFIKAKQTYTNASVMLKTSTDLIEIPEEGKLITFATSQPALRFYNAFEFVGLQASTDQMGYQSGAGGFSPVSGAGQYGIKKIDGIYLGIGTYYQDSRIGLLSTNFKDWTLGPELGTSTAYGMSSNAKGDSIFATSTNNYIYYSSTYQGMSSWSSQTPLAATPYSVYVNAGGNSWVIGYSNGQCYSATNPGTGWGNQGSICNGNGITKFRKVNNTLFALGAGGYFATSTDDGQSWFSNRYVGANVTLTDVSFDGTRYVLTHNSSSFGPYYSTDLSTWNQANVTASSAGNNATHYMGQWIPEESRWIAPSHSQRLLTRTSTNGTSWTIATDAAEWEPTRAASSMQFNAQQDMSGFAQGQGYSEYLVSVSSTGGNYKAARRAAGFEIEIYATGVEVV